MREFDTDDIRVMAAFENITNVGVRDCLRKDTLYFIVNEGKASMAIGKGGQIIKTAEKMLGKPIKIFEFSEDVEEFIKNLIPQAKKIEVNGKNAKVSLESKDRGIVIGRKGSNIKTIRELLGRNSKIEDLKIL